MVEADIVESTDLLLKLKNIESIVECPVCSFSYDKNDHLPCFSTCNCKTLICYTCCGMLPSYGGGRQCPYCRANVTHTPINNKLVDYITEFSDISGDVEKFVEQHSNCGLSQKMLQDLFQFKSDSVIMNDSVDGMMLLATTAIKQASSFETKIKINFQKQKEDLDKYENDIKIRSELMASQEQDIAQRLELLNDREKAISVLEEERNQIKDKMKECASSKQKYEFETEMIIAERKSLEEQHNFLDVRDRSMTEAENDLKIRQNDIDQLQKVIEDEMAQIFKDKTKYDRLNAQYHQKEEKLLQKDTAFEEKFLEFEKDTLKLNSKITNFNESYQTYFDKLRSLPENSDVNKQYIENVLNDFETEMKKYNTKKKYTKDKSLPYLFKNTGNKMSDTKRWY